MNVGWKWSLLEKRDGGRGVAGGGLDGKQVQMVQGPHPETH